MRQALADLGLASIDVAHAGAKTRFRWLKGFVPWCCLDSRQDVPPLLELGDSSRAAAHDGQVELRAAWVRQK